MTVSRWIGANPSALIVAALIRAYQQHISPHKGFGCAVRVRRGGLPCSEFAKRAVLRRGLLGAAPLVRRRLRACAETANSKPVLNYQPLPVPPPEQRSERHEVGDCGIDLLPACDGGCDPGDVVACGSLDCGDCTPW